MELIDNINQLLGDSIKRSITPGAKLKIAASCFSIYAFEALKAELETIDSLEFIFTAPTFVPDEVTDSGRKVRREFQISKAERERGFYGSEFELQLKNKLTQRAIAKECAEWMRRKASFRSNRSKAPMQQFVCLKAETNQVVYQPLHGFTAVDLGYQRGDAVSNFVNRVDDTSFTSIYLSLFEQIWNDPQKIEDVTDRLCEHIAAVYQENSPERIYFLMLYNIFSEFLENITDDVLPNDLTGYQDSLVWKKLYNFQRDAATGIINKLETYNGCILADSVGLGKTFSALAVIKYYELRNRSVLVLCPKKLADNWLNYNRNLTTNIFARDRFNYDVLCHTDLLRNTGESFGTPLNRINWGNYDLVVPEIGDDRKAKINPLNSNFDKKEFQELWKKINQKAAYTVHFDTQELIKKCIKTLDKELKVAPLQYTVQRGIQIDDATPESLKKGEAFKLSETTTADHKVSVHSAVKYDLLGVLAEKTQLMRGTIAGILTGIHKITFDQYKTNPEDFLLNASRLINEQKATVIIEHLAYDPIEDRHSISIFTQEKPKDSFAKAMKVNRHIYDYVFTDSKTERNFVTDLDTTEKVVVYAKLPRGFLIPTPVGNYNPDWAISFVQGTVKHVYFIAETKGSMSTLDLREIEDCKIKCARKFFAKITSDQVRYDVVDSYATLMDLVT